MLDFFLNITVFNIFKGASNVVVKFIKNDDFFLNRNPFKCFNKTSTDGLDFRKITSTDS